MRRNALAKRDDEERVISNAWLRAVPALAVRQHAATESGLITAGFPDRKDFSCSRRTKCYLFLNPRVLLAGACLVRRFEQSPFADAEPKLKLKGNP
jgi:hypothetical protein